MREQLECIEDKTLQSIGLELMFLTPEKCTHPDGITAIEISRKLNIDLDTVKKKLKILFDKNIVKCKGLNPKYWQFDNYNFLRMDEEDPVYSMLCSFEDVDFDKYFNY